MGIMVIGLVAFAAGTAAGLIMAKIMNKVSSKDNQINFNWCSWSLSSSNGC